MSKPCTTALIPAFRCWTSRATSSASTEQPQYGRPSTTAESPVMLLLSVVLLTALVTALISIKCTLLIIRRRQQSEITDPVRRPADSDRLQESITEFGEELDQLTFDPSAARATRETLKDYQLALDAYENAKTMESTEAAHAALQDGLAALIRLDARQHGRPVPIEALQLGAIRHSSAKVVPIEATTERFVSIGTRAGKAEVLIDR